LGMLSSVYKWRLFFIASHPVFAVNNKQYNTIQCSVAKILKCGSKNGNLEQL